MKTPGLLWRQAKGWVSHTSQFPASVSWLYMGRISFKLSSDVFSCGMETTSSWWSLVSGGVLMPPDLLTAVKSCWKRRAENRWPFDSKEKVGMPLSAQHWMFAWKLFAAVFSHPFIPARAVWNALSSPHLPWVLFQVKEKVWKKQLWGHIWDSHTQHNSGLFAAA